MHTVLRELCSPVTMTKSVKLVVVMADVFTAIAILGKAALPLIAFAPTIYTHQTQKAARVIRVRAALLLRFSVLCSSSVSRAA